MSSHVLYIEYLIYNYNFIGHILKDTLYIPNIVCSDDVSLLSLKKHIEPTLAQYWITNKITFCSINGLYIECVKIAGQNKLIVPRIYCSLIVVILSADMMGSIVCMQYGCIEFIFDEAVTFPLTFSWEVTVAETLGSGMYVFICV